MATKMDKVNERKAVLMEKLSKLKKDAVNAIADDKKARSKEETRTKVLMGVLMAASIRENRSGAIFSELGRQADKLTTAEQKFLATSKFWNDLGLPTPMAALQKAPAPAMKTPANQVQVQPPVAPPAPKPTAAKDEAGFLQSIKRTLGG